MRFRIPSSRPSLISTQAFLANVGQEEDWQAVEKKALALGAEKMVIRDLQKEVYFQGAAKRRIATDQKV